MTAVATTPGPVDVSSLLLSSRARRTSHEPFFHFSIEDYLPARTYRTLLETFPTDADFVGEADPGKHGNKRILSSSHQHDLFHALLARQPAWRDLFAAMGSDEFVADLYRLVRPELFRARGVGAVRPWHAGPARSVLAQGVELHFEFSRLTAGSYIMPHTDTPGKLASLLLYFPDPSWQAAYGGGTVFYRPGPGAPRKNWKNLTVPFEALEPVTEIAFVPNRLLVFLKSSTSYHAVPTITCPPAMLRNSVNINYLVPRDHA